VEKNERKTKRKKEKEFRIQIIKKERRELIGYETIGESKENVFPNLKSQKHFLLF